MFIDPISLSHTYVSDPEIFEKQLKGHNPSHIVMLFAVPKNANMSQLNSIPSLKLHGTQLAQDYLWYIVWVNRYQKRNQNVPPQHLIFGGCFFVIIQGHSFFLDVPLFVLKSACVVCRSLYKNYLNKDPVYVDAILPIIRDSAGMDSSKMQHVCNPLPPTSLIYSLVVLPFSNA